jgi:Domain of unknown function (DUF4157)
VNQFAVCDKGVRTSAVAPPTAIPAVSRSAPTVARDLAAAGFAPSRIPASSSCPGAALAARMPLARPSQIPVGSAEKDAEDIPRYTSPVLDVAGKGGGQPLDPKTRTDMEARLGSDFSDVRIHTGDKAARSAAAVSATAYTVGNDVVFGRGSFDPASHQGRHRLAHELVHVQQQRQGPVSGTDSGDGVVISDPADSFERDAEATASRVVSGPQRVSRGDLHDHHRGGSSIQLTEGPSVQRCGGVPCDCATDEEVSVQRDSADAPTFQAEYQLERTPGRWLLAHELTHVVKQNRSTSAVVQRQSTEQGKTATQPQRPAKEHSEGPAAESTAAPARGKDPSCASIYGPPGTPPTHTLVLAQTDIENRAHENLDSWDPYLLQHIPELVGMLFRREEEISWFAAFGVKVAAEILEGFEEKLLPLKILLQACAELAEHAQERRLEEAKAELAEKVTAKLKGERDAMKKDADGYIASSFTKMRGIKMPGCGADLQALKDQVEERWPPMTGEKLEEAKTLVTRVMRMVEDEENKLKRTEFFNECMRITLERPGGIPSDEEVATARKDCDEKSLEKYPW